MVASDFLTRYAEWFNLKITQITQEDGWCLWYFKVKVLRRNIYFPFCFCPVKSDQCSGHVEPTVKIKCWKLIDNLDKLQFLLPFSVTSAGREKKEDKDLIQSHFDVTKWTILNKIKYRKTEVCLTGFSAFMKEMSKKNPELFQLELCSEMTEEN